MTRERLINLAYAGINQKIQILMDRFDPEWSEYTQRIWEQKLKNLERERSELNKMYED